MATKRFCKVCERRIADDPTMNQTSGDALERLLELEEVRSGEWRHKYSPGQLLHDSTMGEPRAAEMARDPLFGSGLGRK